MKIKDILLSTYESLSKWPKRRLIEALEKLRKKYKELEKNIRQFKKENEILKQENKRLKEELEGQKIQSVNKEANKPSSKKAEWEKKGIDNDGRGKKKAKGVVSSHGKELGTVRKILNRIVQRRPR